MYVWTTRIASHTVCKKLFDLFFALRLQDEFVLFERSTYRERHTNFDDGKSSQFKPSISSATEHLRSHSLRFILFVFLPSSRVTWALAASTSSFCWVLLWLKLQFFVILLIWTPIQSSKIRFSLCCLEHTSLANGLTSFYVWRLNQVCLFSFMQSPQIFLFKIVYAKKRAWKKSLQQ